MNGVLTSLYVDFIYSLISKQQLTHSCWILKKYVVLEGFLTLEYHIRILWVECWFLCVSMFISSNYFSIHGWICNLCFHLCQLGFYEFLWVFEPRCHRFNIYEGYDDIILFICVL